MGQTLRALNAYVWRGISIFFPIIVLVGCDLLTSVEKLQSESNANLEARNFSSAAQSAKKWIDKSPEQYEAYFVLAQAQAQVGDKNAALLALEKAIKKGLRDDLQIENNKNLDPIKLMTAYQVLMNTHFPGRTVVREGVREDMQSDVSANSSASITEKDGQQILRAGDVYIQVPANK